MEMRMSSRCFTGSPFDSLGEHYRDQNLMWITMCGDFT